MKATYVKAATGSGIVPIGSQNGFASWPDFLADRAARGLAPTSSDALADVLIVDTPQLQKAVQNREILGILFKRGRLNGASVYASSAVWGLPVEYLLIAAAAVALFWKSLRKLW